MRVFTNKRGMMHPMEGPILLGVLIFTIVFLAMILIGVPNFMEDVALRDMVQQRAFTASDYVAKVCTDNEANIAISCVSSKFQGAQKISVVVGGRQFGDIYKGTGTAYIVKRAVMVEDTPSLLEVSTWY